MSTQKSKIPLTHYDMVIQGVIQTYNLAKEIGVCPELLKSIEKTLELAQLKEEFTEKHTSKDSAGCARLLDESVNHDWEAANVTNKAMETAAELEPPMICGTLEGQFLKSFVSVQRAKKVLEIGMFTGFGALSMAEGLPADGQVVTVDILPYLKEVVQPLLDQYPHGKKVKIVIGDAVQVMKDMASAGEKFDTIFLDADKSQYEEYLKICFDDNLLAPNGTVLVDNAYQQSDAYDPELGETVAKTFGAFLASQQHLHKVLIPMRDGVYMVRRLSDVEGSDAT